MIKDSDYFVENKRKCGKRKNIRKSTNKWIIISFCKCKIGIWNENKERYGGDIKNMEVCLYVDVVEKIESNNWKEYNERQEKEKE